MIVKEAETNNITFRNAEEMRENMKVKHLFTLYHDSEDSDGRIE
jgi:hypothetical protein